MENKRYRIGKVYITATCPEEADRCIVQLAQRSTPSYVCVSNARTVTLANRDAAYRAVMHRAAMCLPDGMPLVWMARLWGLREVQRTTGPDLFVRLVGHAEHGLKHFLLGDTEETLQAMRTKFSEQGSRQIVGTLSPAFCELDDYDYPSIAAQIAASGADVVWLSLRAPKQDLFAARLQPYLQRGVCIGVGAAFRFSLGELKHPPRWAQKMGVTGLFWRKINLRLIANYCKFTWMVCRWSISILWARLRGETPMNDLNEAIWQKS